MQLLVFVEELYSTVNKARPQPEYSTFGPLHSNVGPYHVEVLMDRNQYETPEFIMSLVKLHL